MHAHYKNYGILFISSLLWLPTTCAFSETRWPVFVAPDSVFLLKNNYIDTNVCPEGEGRLVAGVVINIQQFLCKTFCPGNWNWIANSDGECHSLLTDFDFQQYDVKNTQNDEGEANNSRVTAFYGNSTSSVSSFSFVMTTLSGEYWQCFEMNSAMHLISCTNDI